LGARQLLIVVVTSLLLVGCTEESGESDATPVDTSGLLEEQAP